MTSAIVKKFLTEHKKESMYPTNLIVNSYNFYMRSENLLDLKPHIIREKMYRKQKN